MDKTFNISLQDQSVINNVHDSNMHASNPSSSMCAPNSLNLQLNNKGFKIGQINVQGIQSKMDQTDLMLNNSSNNIHILGICETKLKSIHPDSYFCIDNYKFFRRDRIISTERSEQGGGIIVYVKTV